MTGGEGENVLDAAVPPKAPPRAARSLRRDFRTSFTGNTVYAASQWALLVLLAQIGSPVMVGQYSLALALTAPAIMLGNMRLASLLASDAVGEHPLHRWVSARVLSSTIAMLVIGAIVVLGGYRGAVAGLIIVVGLAKFLESFIDILYGYLGQQHEFTAVARSLIVRSVVTPVIVGVVGVMTGSVAWMALGLMASWAVLLFALDIPVAVSAVRRHAGQGSTATWPVGGGVRGLLAGLAPDAAALRLLQGALPLGFVALSLALVASVPRLFISGNLGDAAVGYYSAAAYVVVGGRMVASALGAVALPRLGVHLANRDRSGFVHVLRRLVLFGLAFGVAGVAWAFLFGRPFLGFVYGPSYAEEAPTLVWLMAASGLGYVSSFLQDSLTTVRELGSVLIVVVVTTVAIAAACAVLIPRMGLIGAGLAVFIGSSIEVAGSALFVSRAMRKMGRAP